MMCMQKGNQAVNNFEEERRKFFAELGESKNMVLSTSADDKVTSRMMSVIMFAEKTLARLYCRGAPFIM